MIYANGAPNLAALNTPDVVVVVGAPPIGPATGTPTNILGIVGTGAWGPVNSPVIVGPQQVASAFGPLQNRLHDIGTHAAIAAQQGANVFACVRVSDGTDVAASVAVQTGGGTLTAIYTGSVGNNLRMVIAAGTAANTFKATLSLPNAVPETFDNLSGAGNAIWQAIGAAINTGQGVARGPSQLAIFTPGASVIAPIPAIIAPIGGSDGAATITGTTLIGTDGATRTGMYALRGSGAAIVILTDCATPTTWATQLAYALSEVCELVDCTQAGDTPTGFAVTVATQGIDSPWFKAMLGDWVYWLDTINNATRLVSPTAVYAGLKVSQLPSQSALNKPVQGVVGTQKSSANQTYSAADLQTIAGARGDVITKPVPGGNYFGCRFGRNSSSDPGRHQDAYTTMTNFLATTLNLAGGQFVGLTMTTDEQREAQSSISAFLQGLSTPQAGPAQMGPFSVAVTSNNATGTQVAVVQIQYLGIIEYFVIDLVGGQTVQIVNVQQAQQYLAA